MVKTALPLPFATKETLVGFILYEGHPIARHDTGGVRLTLP